MNSHDPQRFENFRRERNRRRLNQGPKRDLGANARVLREIEEAEAREARNAQLTREVQEFFEGATRAAASIVSQVSEKAEEQVNHAVAEEMSEFLTATIQRAQMFIEMMRRGEGNVSMKNVEPQMSKLVGPLLDEFRHAGTAHVADQHIGLDPFRVDGGAGVESLRAGPEPSEDDRFVHLPMPAAGGDVVEIEEVDDGVDVNPIEDHLVAEVLGRDTFGMGPGEECPAAVAWFERIAGDVETLKTALKVLVHYDAMSRDEARAIYQEFVTAT